MDIGRYWTEYICLHRYQFHNTAVKTDPSTASKANQIREVCASDPPPEEGRQCLALVMQLRFDGNATHNAIVQPSFHRLPADMPSLGHWRGGA